MPRRNASRSGGKPKVRLDRDAEQPTTCCSLLARPLAATHPKKSAPVPLLRLPDELLLHVFELVCEEHQHSRLFDARPPMHYLRICKRINALILPRWYRKLVVPSYGSRSDLFMTGLLRHQKVHSLVQDIDFDVTPDAMHLHMLVVSQLHALRSLSVSFEELYEEEEEEIPDSFQNLLADLPLLRRLTFRSAPPFEDGFAYFLLSERAPTIEHIECFGESLLTDILGALQLRSLKLRSVPDVVVIPWLDLERLELTSHHFNKVTYEKLLKSVKQEVRSSSELSRFAARELTWLLSVRRRSRLSAARSRSSCVISSAT